MSVVIKPFCTPAVEIAGRAKETLALDDSRPGVDGNVTPPPIPATGTVPFYCPTDPSVNPIGEVMNTSGKVTPVPNVIAKDGDQNIT